MIRRHIQYGIGLSLTPNLMRHEMYRFSELNWIVTHRFNAGESAGKDWMRQFRGSNPDLVSTDESSMSTKIVHDYFYKFWNSFDELDILDKPRNVFNMKETWWRLTICTLHNSNYCKTLLVFVGAYAVIWIRYTIVETADSLKITLCLPSNTTPLLRRCTFRLKRTLGSRVLQILGSSYWPNHQ